MPIYEYSCRACGERFSELYRSYEAALAQPPICPHCHSAETERRISNVAVHGAPRVDTAEVAAEHAKAERMAGTTSKEQIDSWRKGTTK